MGSLKDPVIQETQYANSIYFETSLRGFSFKISFSNKLSDKGFNISEYLESLESLVNQENVKPKFDL
jgi:hypothetical protein